MSITINSERLITTVIKLCAIHSPSGQEEGVAAYIRREAQALGFAADSDEWGNLFIKNNSGHRESVFLSSHMDTVPVAEGKKIRVIRQDGKISSDGTTILGGDDKQGVAAALEILRLSKENPGIHRNLELIFTVKEEVGSVGSGAMDSRRITAESGFNLDGETAPGTVIRKAPHKEKFVCTVKGVSSHAALEPEDGISAVLIASRIIGALPLGVPGPESTSNVGSIHGGRQSNIVPDHCVFEGELRSFSSTEFEMLQKRFDKIVLETAADLGGKAEIQWNPCYSSYEIADDEECCLWFKEACEKQKIKPSFVSSRGGGDSNQLNNKGLRNLVFGLGMHHIHSVDEYLLEEEYCKAFRLLAQIVFPDSKIS